MAVKYVANFLFENAISKLSDAIKLSLHFESKLGEMEETLKIMGPIFEYLKEGRDRPRKKVKRFIKTLKKAEHLVQECSNIRWNIWRRYWYALKLDKMNKSLLNSHLQLQNAREAVLETKAEERGLKRGLEEGSSSGVPMKKCAVIGFDNSLRDLKTMVLRKSSDGDCSIVVVSAPEGYGKTTFVTMLCNDPDIKGRFRSNIHFVTVSLTYDLKVIIQNLLERSQLRGIDSDEDAIPERNIRKKSPRGNHVRGFESDEVAKQHWQNFLGQNKSETLLILDDVRSVSIIMDFKFKSPGYKIVVTSREPFTQFNTYQLPILKDEDAFNLFCSSAFSNHSNPDIPDDLVVQLVSRCKYNPLALSVIGGMLKGKCLKKWEFMLKKLSSENNSVLDCLQKGLHLLDEEPDIKQHYMDLALYPEDQKIRTTKLMYMWEHLHNHDEAGLVTADILAKLSSRKLATLLPIRENSIATAYHGKEKYVTQHKTMRELAIRLSSQMPIEYRERLIINTDGKDLQGLPQIVNARILSISTDARLSSTWNEIQFPRLEVLVLNATSKIHSLPHFMKNMQTLKVLSITNNGYHFSEIENFPAAQCFPGLTRITLDGVSIPSISTTILKLENLEKLSMITCKIDDGFNKGIPNNLKSLLEINIESCDDLVTYPASLCNLLRLEKLCITSCHELKSLSEEFVGFPNLKILQLVSCTRLITLPENIGELKQLKVLTLSHCLSLVKLPRYIYELGSLQTIDLRGCTHLHELPTSAKDFGEVKVICDEETSPME